MNAIADDYQFVIQFGKSKNYRWLYRYLFASEDFKITSNFLEMIVTDMAESV